MVQRLALGVSQVVLMALVAISAQAQDNPAVECMSLPGSPRATVRIERSFGSFLQDATVRTATRGSFHRVSLQSTIGWDRVVYWGNDFDLQIDTFISNGIQFNTPYWATLTTGIVGGGNPTQMRCEFLRF